MVHTEVVMFPDPLVKVASGLGNLIKGSLSSLKWMNFQRISKQPLPPSRSFFRKKITIFFRAEMTPPPPFGIFMKVHPF